MCSVPTCIYFVFVHMIIMCLFKCVQAEKKLVEIDRELNTFRLSENSDNDFELYKQEVQSIARG